MDWIFVVGTLLILIFVGVSYYGSEQISLSPGSDVLFEFEGAGEEIILLSNDLDFISARRIPVRDDVVISLERGVYYWKIEALDITGFQDCRWVRCSGCDSGVGGRAEQADFDAHRRLRRSRRRRRARGGERGARGGSCGGTGRARSDRRLDRRGRAGSPGKSTLDAEGQQRAVLLREGSRARHGESRGD